MNYKSQLKGWAVDRVIEGWKALNFVASDGSKWLDTLKAQADDLAAYAYVAEEDLSDACRRVVDLLKDMPDALEKVHALQNELAFIEEQMQAQLARTVATEKKETVQ